MFFLAFYYWRRFFSQTSWTTCPVFVLYSMPAAYRDITHISGRNYVEKCVPVYSFYFTILHLQKRNTDADSNSVPVLGYYYMPFISLDPNHQLLVFPCTLTHTHTHFTFPCTLSLQWSHSLSVSHRKPATTDASHKPITPNPTHAPIFGAKNEADKLEMVSVVP